MSETQNLPEADFSLLELAPRSTSAAEPAANEPVRDLCARSTVWNERMNLTAIIERGDVQTKHLLDSLVSLPLIAVEINVNCRCKSLCVRIDVGTGACWSGPSDLFARLWI